MNATEDDPLIADKLWFLVGILLRKGQSCTPSQLSHECHLFRFPSGQIEALCKLPFSPLSLSDSGQVTFSHLVFTVLNGIKDRYAMPSIAFLWQDHPSTASLSSYIQKTLPFCPPFITPQVRCLSGYSDSEPTFVSASSSFHQLYSLSCTIPGLQKPLSGVLKLPTACFNLQSEISSGEGRPLTKDTLSLRNFRKRLREDIWSSSLCKVKQQKISIMNVAKTSDCSLLTASFCFEGDAHAGSNIAHQCFFVKDGGDGGHHATSLILDSVCPGTDSPAALSGGDYKGGTETDISEVKCNVSQHFTATNLKSLEKSVLNCFTKTEGAALPESGEIPATLLYTATEMEVEEDLCANILPVERDMDNQHENQAENVRQGNCDVVGQEVNHGYLKQECNDTISVDIAKRNRQEDIAEEGVSDHRMVEAKGIHIATRMPKPAKARGKSKTGMKQKVENSNHASKSLKNVKSNRPELAAIGASAGPSAAGTMGPNDVELLGSSKQQPVKTKVVPSFEGFAVEAVEGSGGYGTVYKALRKSDGKVFAIKYPFDKTSAAYVSNEIKVLQRFGGRYSIPEYVGVIEESGRKCLVLEYIEHEKPEVLKKEISISELQWYGFSLFKALAFLHEKGVTHRDVKPGNFLFSRQRQCGSLVDFNLAVVQPRQGPSAKSRKVLASERTARSEYSFGSYQGGTELCRKQTSGVSSREHKSMPGQSSPNDLRMNAAHEEAAQVHEKAYTPSGTPVCDLKQSGEAMWTIPSKSRHAVQVTPGHHQHKPPTSESGWEPALHDLPKFSGVRTSPVNGKTYQSTDTASPALNRPRPRSVMYRSPSRDQDRVLQSGQMQYGDLAKEPLPKLGRRELLDYAEKTRNSPQPQVASLFGSQRKRVAAPHKKKNQRNLLDQGLPRRSTSPVSKKSYLKTPLMGHLPRTKGIYKLKNEGPCAGTKGYRAPEVLLKSLLQSEKIDIWSAGISLFQLLLGKPPFPSSSNINQSLIDIAQFCGIDAIINLAKEHCREDSLSKEFATHKTQPTSVFHWCAKYTKRPEMLDLVPPALYDLIDKCLQVNPRNRISASQAVQHEFFNSCRAASSRNKDNNASANDGSIR